MKNPEIDEVGNQKWYNEKRELHREDGPICAYGNQYWCQNGKYHRIDGPAVIKKDSTKEYWINDIKYSKEDFLKHPEVITYQKLKELL